MLLITVWQHIISGGAHLSDLAVAVEPVYERWTHGQCDAKSMVTFSTCSGTHCAYPQRDGQAELTWAADYVLRHQASSMGRQFGVS